MSLGTRGEIQCVPESAVEQQRANFTALLERLGQASPEEVKAILDEREPAEPEPELTPEIVTRLRARIAGKAAQSDRAGRVSMTSAAASAARSIR